MSNTSNKKFIKELDNGIVRVETMLKVLRDNYDKAQANDVQAQIDIARMISHYASELAALKNLKRLLGG